MTRYYIQLQVYNYDAYPRQQTVRHYVESPSHAEQIAARLRKLVGRNIAENRTRRWVGNHLHIDGFIEAIDGIYEETTRRIA
jgi:hypothetical protein